MLVVLLSDVESFPQVCVNKAGDRECQRAPRIAIEGAPGAVQGELSLFLRIGRPALDVAQDIPRGQPSPGYRLARNPLGQRFQHLPRAISAALCGLAGGLFAMAQHSAFPDVMNLTQSGYVVMMVLVGGGLVSFWGPVIGVAVFLLARDV